MIVTTKLLSYASPDKHPKGIKGGAEGGGVLCPQPTHPMPLPYIPYRIKHKTYARENRSRPTVTEKIVRKSMLSGRPLGYKFTRQKPL